MGATVTSHCILVAAFSLLAVDFAAWELFYFHGHLTHDKADKTRVFGFLRGKERPEEQAKEEPD